MSRWSCRLKRGDEESGSGVRVPGSGLGKDKTSFKKGRLLMTDLRFKTDDFITQCGCRSVGECTHGFGATFDALYAMVDAAAVEMKKKLKEKVFEHRHGWDDPVEWPSDNLRVQLREHVEKGDPIDVMNFAVMLWNRRESTAQPTPAETPAEKGPKKMYILAETHRDYLWHRDHFGLGPDNCVYVSDKSVLHGLHDIRYIVVGHWYKKPEYQNMMGDLKLIGKELMSLTDIDLFIAEIRGATPSGEQEQERTVK